MAIKAHEGWSMVVYHVWSKASMRPSPGNSPPVMAQDLVGYGLSSAKVFSLWMYITGCLVPWPHKA